MFVSVYIILIVLTLIAIYWGHVKSGQGQGTPSLYIIQTYLYIIISLLIVALTNQQINHYNINIDLRYIVISFLVAISSIFIMHLWSKDSIYTKHIFWIIFIICMGILVAPVVSMVSIDRLNQNILIVVGLMVILSVIAYLDRNNIFPPMTKYLIIGLFVMIIVELSDLFFFSQTDTYHSRNKIYDVIVIMLFVFFVLADTQSLKEKAMQCGHSACIDYPTESTKIFLDILNIFTRVTSLRSKN